MKLPSAVLVRSLSIAAFLVFVVGAGNDCMGQQSTSDLSEASLEELGNLQVYSASKHMQSSGEAPSSVTVISADEIQKYGYRTLADILRTVRSFYVTYDRNYSSLGVRGFARPGDFNTRILLLVDGHRLNDNIYDEAMIGTEFPVDVDLIQRIEIVRGPVSSLYGSNALFAAINIITRRAEDINGLDLSAAVASFNTGKGRISYGRALKRFKFLVSGSFYGSRGQNQLFFPEFNTSETNNGIANHADDDQQGTALATISFHDLTLEAVYGTREKGIPTAAYDTIFNNTGTRTTDTHGYVDLRYEHTFRGSWDVLARASYDRYTYQGTYIYPSPVNPAQLDPNLDFADGKWWGTELQLTKTVLSKNRVTVGGEYRDNIRQNQSNHDLNPFSLLLNDERHSFVAALFLQDEITLNKSVALNLGFRYDYYSSVDSSTDPRAALIYRPWSKTALKAIYGEAFRVPNVYEKYYSAPPIAPNPALKPEKIRSAEFVWEQSISDRLWLSASAFRNTMDDLITQQSQDDGSYIFRNIQKTKSDGIELEVKGQLSNGFEGIASYSFQDSDDRDSGQSLSNSPRHLAKLNLIQPLLRRNLFASFDAQYRSRMTTLTGSSVSPFAIVNFDLLGRKIGKQIDISAGVYNLLDKEYYDPPSTAVSQAAIQQDGRTFQLKMTWNLGVR
jgi:outer membrane receptor for ferrienterochelin and colicins